MMHCFDVLCSGIASISMASPQPLLTSTGLSSLPQPPAITIDSLAASGEPALVDLPSMPLQLGEAQWVPNPMGEDLSSFLIEETLH
jgi:hypothetical protein